jgi:hypothetical protein
MQQVLTLRNLKAEADTDRLCNQMHNFLGHQTAEAVLPAGHSELNHAPKPLHAPCVRAGQRHVPR